MAVEYICDNCGKREPGEFRLFPSKPARLYWDKPSKWSSLTTLERGDMHPTQEWQACSRDCLKAIEKKHWPEGREAF